MKTAKAKTEAGRDLRASYVMQQFRCSRCGHNHERITFRRLARDMVVNFRGEQVVYQYWATCPANGDPILLRLFKTVIPPSTPQA